MSTRKLLKFSHHFVLLVCIRTAQCSTDGQYLSQYHIDMHSVIFDLKKYPLFKVAEMSLDTMQSYAEPGFYFFCPYRSWKTKQNKRKNTVH